MNTTFEPTERQIATVRSNIMRQITTTQAAVLEHPAAHPARRRVGYLSIGVATVAAALVVGGIVVPQTGQRAQAATVLNSAADLTIKTSDPVVQPGQYLKIDTNAVYATVGQASDGTKVTWLRPSNSVIYKPGTASSDWVLQRHTGAPTTFYGPGAKAAALTEWATDQNDPLTNGTFRAKDGAFYGHSSPVPSTAGLPRDPHKLYDYLSSISKGGSNSADEATWVAITDLLRTGTVPADLRSSLYRAAALVPGIKVIPGDVTLDGRTGVALGRVESSRAERQDIIIDPATGDLIGERTVQLTSKFNAPAGTAVESTAVTTRVVDAAP
jgi:RNA polymerase sigma-70 factor (ECF subfamily)